jgi:SAM-dependent methyltransferase
VQETRETTKDTQRLVASGGGERGKLRREESECRICGGTLVPVLRDVADSLTGERFDVQRCSQCGVGQTTPFPDDLQPYYASYHGDRHGLTGQYRVRRRLRLVQHFVSSCSENRLLDVGCGDGSFMLAAQRSGWRVCGTELKREPPCALGLDVRSEIGQFNADQPFDCVTLWHSLEHLTDPRKVLAQTHDLLRPQGVLLVSVPDNAGWQARFYGRHWMHLDVPRHLFHFDRTSLERLLEATGFRPIRHWHEELEYDLVGWSQSALNLIGPERNVFFNSLTGKRVGVGKPGQAAHIGLGLLLSAAALPLVFLGSLFRRGGTLVVAARREA